MIRSAILISSISRNAGGLFESVRHLGLSLQQAGVDVNVFSSADRFSDEDIRQWLPIKPLVFPTVGPPAFGYAPGLCQSLKRTEYDIAHCHGIWMYQTVANMMASRRCRKPYMISPHGMLDPWAVRNSHWKKVLAANLYEDTHLRGASCIRALCNSEQDAIRTYGLKNPVCVIPNGIDLPTSNSFCKPPWSEAVLEGKKVLLYLGRIHPKKGLVNLLKAWQSCKADGSNLKLSGWTLVIAGWDQGGHETELRSLANDLGIGQEVVFVGPQFDVAKQACYHHADAFILPSFSEGLPMVVLEAWAHHLPVIMTPQCNLPEGVEADAAINVDTAAEDIVKGLMHLSGMTAAERQSMGERGFQLVRERFSWTNIAEDTKRVYEWILGGGSPPACVRMD